MAERKFIKRLAGMCSEHQFDDLLETIYATPVNQPTATSATIPPAGGTSPTSPRASVSDDRMAADSNSLTKFDVAELKAAKDRVDAGEGDENDEVLGNKYGELLDYRKNSANAIAAKVDATINT